MIGTGSVILESIVCCPVCGWKELETMPVDACQWFYQCRACNTLLKPGAGHCCIFCSYGTEKCPPVQQSRSCCAAGSSHTA